MALHINIEDLLSARTVESDRIEFKEGWNPDAIYRSICAFANDFDNIGAGYILIGVVENPLTKTALRPVKGLSSKQIGDIQQQMIGYNNLLKPYYAPRLFIEEVDGQQIIVLWIIGGNERPYEVPETITAKHKNWKYFIRKYANSIEAKGTDKEELITLTNNIPFDDRVNSAVNLSDISMLRLKDYLKKVNSKLALEVGVKTDIEILSQMALVSGPKEFIFPRNVALMLFTDNPHQYFPYSWVEIVHFPNGAADKEFTEKRIDGPIHQQVIDTLTWLRTIFLQERVTKIPTQAEANRAWNYPYEALEEAVANCLFHRNYQEREPVKIRVEPNFILLYNLGGPDRSIKREDFETDSAVPKRYRNRRLGDFLKELKLTEGHSTGMPTIRRAMKRNGSPEPIFDFDEDRTWFSVKLPIHETFKKQNVVVSLNEEILNKNDINKVLEEIIKQANINSSDIAGDIHSDIAGHIEIIDNEAVRVISLLEDNTSSDIAGDIACLSLEKETKLMQKALKPVNRETLLAANKLQNYRKNYIENIQPLINLNWLAMTHPTKPTSPKQQYYTTLKGRLVLGLLNKTK